MLRGLAQRNSIVRQIERRETSFIRRLLPQFKQMHTTQFSQHLTQEIGKRYASANLVATGRISGRWTSIGDLYACLNQLTSSLTHRQSSPAPSNASVGLLVSVNDYYAAQTIADYP